jgi:hypothetical protein
VVILEKPASFVVKMAKISPSFLSFLLVASGKNPEASGLVSSRQTLNPRGPRRLEAGKRKCATHEAIPEFGSSLPSPPS